MKINSGPMLESSQDSVFTKSGAHYNIYSCPDEKGMDYLKQFFPEGDADELNFCLFSTSGIHGSYLTIEDIEDIKNKDEVMSLTFLIVHPRIVCMRYGNCIPKSKEDFEYLKKLRNSSWKAVQNIGNPS